jgi:hypothetical protein
VGVEAVIGVGVGVEVEVDLVSSFGALALGALVLGVFVATETDSTTGVTTDSTAGVEVLVLVAFTILYYI